MSRRRATPRSEVPAQPRFDQRVNSLYGYAVELPRRLDVREDGRPHTSGLSVFKRACKYPACGQTVPQRERGRPRQFCDSTCRSRYRRAFKPLFSRSDFAADE